MKISYSLLDADFLASELGKLYSLGSVARAELVYPSYIRFYSRGSNDIYIVETDDKRYTLRISNARRSRDSVEAETELLQQASMAGLAVCRPIEMLNGALSFEFEAPEGARQGVLFEFIDGEVNIPLKSPTAGRSIGSAIGKFHLWSDRTVVELPSSDPVPDLTHVADWSHSLLLPRKDQLFIATVAERTMTAIEQPDDYGLCHGDLVGGNTINTRKGVYLFDFEHIGLGSRAYDLTTLRLSIQPDVVDEVWDSVLDGYRSHRPLSTTVIAQVPLFSVARQLWIIGIQKTISEHWGQTWERDRMRDNVATLRTLCEGLFTHL